MQKVFKASVNPIAPMNSLFNPAKIALSFRPRSMRENVTKSEFQLPKEHSALTQTPWTFGEYASVKIGKMRVHFYELESHFVTTDRALIKPADELYSVIDFSDIRGILYTARELPRAALERGSHTLVELQNYARTHDGFGVNIQESAIYIPAKFHERPIRDIVKAAKESRIPYVR